MLKLTIDRISTASYIMLLTKQSCGILCLIVVFIYVCKNLQVSLG